MQGLNDCRGKRKRDVTDPQTDELFIRVILRVSFHLLRDRGKKIASLQFQIVFIDLEHFLTPPDINAY